MTGSGVLVARISRLQSKARPSAGLSTASPPRNIPMARVVRWLGTTIVLVACLTGCGAAPSPTTSRQGDLARLLEHTAQLRDHAEAMSRAATGGTVVQAPDAKEAYRAMVTIAAADQPWVGTADLPSDLRTTYQRLLKNVELNASRLTDGSDAGYFRFLGSSLAPLWIQDIDATRSLVDPKGSGLTSGLTADADRRN
jgi:hypothetical protein